MTEELKPYEDVHPPYMKRLKKSFDSGNDVKCNGRSVAIIGAGMAGLVAAWLLKQAGFTVEIFEASVRVGGRVRTLREGFSSELYAAAGAMRIPQDHRYTLFLCEQFRLAKYRFPESDPNALV